jgi:hypothetical protein
LLFDAVLEEVKDQFPTFAPTIKREGVSEFILYGNYYHHVYDFLYVVIFNAAKYGRQDGILLQRIELDREGPQQLKVSIVVGSQIRACDSVADVQENIRLAMAGSIEDAMVIEGRSGIKKLLRLESDVKEITAIDVAFEGDMIMFSCSLTLAET